MQEKFGVKKNAAILKELRAISKKTGGVVRPIDVVEFASNPKTALHKQFTWDDTKAAERWRLFQARQILRVTVTMIPRANKSYRAFVSLTPDRSSDEGGGYRLTAKVLSDTDMRSRLLSDAIDELQTFKRKYSVLNELSSVFAAIDEVSTMVAQ